MERWGFCTVPELDMFDESGMSGGRQCVIELVVMCSYNDILKADRNYTNPYACTNMVSQIGIAQHTSFLHDLSFPDSQNYESMRRVQNQRWAEQRLQRGVEFAKEGKLNEAIRCYSEAIELVPTYADAFTARGAA